jgi:transposase-like protein
MGNEVSTERRGFDGKILPVYGPGLPAKAIQENLKEIYNVEASPELISRATDEAKGLAEEWRGRSLEAFCPVLFMDALRVNIRDGGQVTKKPAHMAPAVRLDGRKGFRFRGLSKTRGRSSGRGCSMSRPESAGHPDSGGGRADRLSRGISAAFPGTEVHLCADFSPGSHGPQFGEICFLQRPQSGHRRPERNLPGAVADAAKAAPGRFAGTRDGKCPAVSQSWRNRRNEVVPFMKFSPEIRKAIYTTNAIEPVNCTPQRKVKTRLSFPNGEPAMKLLFMILRRISRKRAMLIRNWGEALHQFLVIYGDRVPL